MTVPDLRQAPFVLLDDSRPMGQAGRSLLFHTPDEIITARTLADVPAALAQMDARLADGLHLAGWVAYECAAAFEPRLRPLMTRQADEPLIWMLATRHRALLAEPDLQEALHTAQRGTFRRSDLRFGQSVETRESYLAALNTIHDLIHRGDVYQINHTFPLPCGLSGDVLELYSRLRASQPVPFGALIDTGQTRVLSLSPELFVRRQGNRLTSRPMKGTAPRGRTTAEDAAIATHLASDEKSRAENLMIVDLIRNDLSRLAKPGSVAVQDLFTVEKYSTLLQMTSTVEAEARDSLTPSALLAALFPCGSVTGAPKVRAMEIINSLEKAPRGIYCGAIGHFSPSADGPDWTLNVPIRTLVLDTAGQGRLSVGSGVVADSRPDGEYDECLLKARFAHRAAPDFALIETLGYSPADGFSHLDAHLARLADSASYFDYPCDLQAVRAMLDDHITATKPTTPKRVRLLLDKGGRHSATSMPLPPVGHVDDLPSVCLSGTRVASDDIFLCHKTTERRLYDTTFTRAHKAGHADILFFNERDELTEGAISNVYLVKDGIWRTPKLGAGLLPGIHRRWLLDQSDQPIEECTLTRADLLAADSVYIGNSVRGLRLVSLVPQEL